MKDISTHNSVVLVYEQCKCILTSCEIIR